jgi:hypothetical protein
MGSVIDRVTDDNVTVSIRLSQLIRGPCGQNLSHRPPSLRRTIGRIRAVPGIKAASARALRGRLFATSIGGRSTVIAPGLRHVERGFHLDLADLYDLVMADTPLPGRLICDADAASAVVNGSRPWSTGARSSIASSADCFSRRQLKFSEAHLRYQVFCPDKRLHKLFSDKTNFAVLHAAGTAGWLSEADARLVEEYIPLVRTSH